MKTQMRQTGKFVSRAWLCLWLVLTVPAVLGAGPVAAADDWLAGAGADWDTAMSAARAEGEVVVAGPAQIAETMARVFEEDTGIKVNFLGGGSRDIRTRFRKELATGVLTIDVKIGGAGEIAVAKNGLLEPLAPHLMLPSVSDSENWIEDRIKWVDNTKTFMPIPNEYISGWVLMNRDILPEGTVTTWQDLLKPEFKGRIVAYDPTTGGPGQAAASYMGERFGKDYLRQLYVGQEVTLVRRGRQLVESVALGNHAIAIGAVAPNVERFREAGMTSLYAVEMADGPGNIIGGNSIAVIGKKAPHPNAAIVFLNWYLSPRGQQIYRDIWQTPSRRRDISVEGLPDYVIPKSDRVYLDQYQEDWYITNRSQWKKFLGGMIEN